MARSGTRPGRLGLVVLSFLWAVALWFYAGEEMVIEREVDVTINLRPPEQRLLSILEPEPSDGKEGVRVSVTVKGARGEVYAVSGKDIRFQKTLDATLPEEPVAVSLSPSDFFIPDYPDVRVVSVRPASIKILLSEAAGKVVPVRVIPTGKPGKGFVLATRPRTIPESVEVRASPEIVDKVEFVETEPVDISGASRSFSVLVRLSNKVKVDGTVHEVSLAQDKVVVLIDIEEAPVDVVREHVPVRVLVAGGCPFKIIPERSTVSLTLRGSETKIASLGEDAVSVYLDASSIDSVPEHGTMVFPVRVLLPDGVELVPGSVPGQMKARVE